MKNVFKKLFSLMLVAVMLVSVLPVTAMAAVEDQVTKKVNVVINTAKTENDPIDSWTQDDYIQFELEGPNLTDDQIAQVKAKIADKGITGWNIGSAGATSGGGLKTLDFSQTTDELVAVYPVGDFEVGAPEEPVVCDECGEEEGHKDTCSKYECSDCGARINAGEKHTDDCSQKPATTKEVSISFQFKGTEIATGTVTVEAGALTVDAAELREVFESDTYKVPDGDIKYDIKDGKCTVSVVEKNPTNSKTVKLVNGDDEYTVTLTVGKNVPTLPEGEKKLYKEFKGWFDSDNDQLRAGDPVTNLTDYEAVYTAKYLEDADGSDDGLSVLTIKAKLYSNKKLVKTETVVKYTLEDGTYLVDWLNDNDGKIESEIYANSWASGYEWEPHLFYNMDSSLKLTDQDKISNGDKTIYVKLNATEDLAAKVVLYVHSKLSDKTPEDHVITGYVKNGEVDRDDVWDFIKDEYKTNSKTKLDGLYSKKTWGQKVNGEDPDAAEELTIDTNEYYEVHVILTNASSKADSSNPKTGDSIYMTMTVMTLSAVALAGAYIFNKKRMAQ